jgi:outer membrane protein assembly factor BamD
MIRAYDKLGMFDLRDDTQRVFTKNYPNSRFLAARAAAMRHGGSSGRSRGRRPAPKDGGNRRR